VIEKVFNEGLCILGLGRRGGKTLPFLKKKKWGKKEEG